MNKKYNKAICLDTCIFTKVVGFPDANPNYNKKYNEEILIKYIKHHGYNISDYNLYEVLRRDDWNDEKVISNLLKLNSKINEKLKSKHPEFKKIIENKPNEKSRNHFIKTMFTNIVDFASDFYSQILVFPFLFVIYAILNYYKIYNLKFNSITLSHYAKQATSIIKKQLKQEFLQNPNYTKSSAQKILNKYYLILNHLTIEWSNSQVCNLSENLEKHTPLGEDILYNILDNYIKDLNSFDYTHNIRINDGHTKANNTDNIIYLISNQGFNKHKDKFTNEEWSSNFSQFIKNLFNALYDSTGINKIIKTYYEINITNFYIKHILNCEEKKEHRKLLDFIDPNDLIDLCALSDSYEQGFLFISTDSKINKIIDIVYTKKQKEFLNLFIDFQFSN